MKETMVKCEKCRLEWDFNSYPYDCPLCEMKSIKEAANDAIDKFTKRSAFCQSPVPGIVKELRKIVK